MVQMPCLRSHAQRTPRLGHRRRELVDLDRAPVRERLRAQVQRRRDLVGVRRTGVRDHLELHDLARVGEVDVVLVAQVAQLDLRTDLVLAEVDQHLVALRDAVPPGLHRVHLRRHPGVGADHVHRVAGAEREPERTGDAGRQHAEPVHPGLDLHLRPRHAVDQDDVAHEAHVLRVVEGGGAVGVERHVADDQRDVELALRQLRPLVGVAEVVLRGQAGEDVLGGVAVVVVVVPQGAGLLPVRVLVGLGVARGRLVVGVPVVLRQRRRAVQVRHRAERQAVEALDGQVVGDPHLAAGALR